MPQSKSLLQSLVSRDTILLLRIPFSYYLFPVFLCGFSQSSNIHATTLLLVFIAQHFFIYPGSNIYNSYMDQDTGAIGGLENPPPATKDTYYVSMVYDLAGLLICSFAGPGHVLVMLGYIAFSKSYSWMGIRLKKMPILGWLSVAFFQGAWTFMQGCMAAEDNAHISWFTIQHLEAMVFAMLIIGGSYPLTQIYQHEEDSERGDYTISWKLGIRGTFIFSSVFFGAGALTALHYFYTYYTLLPFFIFVTCLSPVIIYFTRWMLISFKEPKNADYKHAMLMTKISATCMVVCFCVITWLNYWG